MKDWCCILEELIEGNGSGQVLYNKSHLNMIAQMLNLQQKALHSCPNLPWSRPMLTLKLCKFMKVVDHIQDSITD